SAEEALRCVRARMPDVLVSDIGMPGEDGYSLVEKVFSHAAREKEKRPVAIAVTAFVTSADRIRALRVGFDAHVPKPIEADELISTVADLVRTRLTAPSKVG
ncbi:MAG: response regulator, partial [Polyangiaceae bacterium]